ncbi:hypothetical protein [Halalkalibacter urbisdiaboli]|uniref:hypothetical protein n=1 Tax=Halalkalibacter urbisdiaboli TaxID=1960589 RepID=UPI000B45092B|nr:hypothetical protein [Halalkalibacter urbisdiaboli]
MKEFLLNKDTERSRLTHLLLASTSLLLAFFGGTFFFILAATTMILFSNVEKSQNNYIKAYGTILYIIIISWYLYQLGMWIYTRFII